MQAKFTAIQTVTIPVPPHKISIQHYLRQPQRLVHSLVDPSQAQQLSDDCFRLKMRSRQFMMLTLQPIVDIRLWTDEHTVLHLEAIRCELGGLDFVNQCFQLSLNGFLALSQDQTLEGQADLGVSVEIPPILWMTPKSIIIAAGNSMLKSILASVKHRLVQQVVQDYQEWAEAVTDTTSLETSSPRQVLPNLL